MDLQLRGKTAVIAAASRGIGKAIAEQLAREGANLFLCSRNEQQLKDTVESIQSTYPVQVDGMVVDLRDPRQISKWMDHIQKQTRQVDALVCNSGGPPTGRFLTFDDQAWEQAFQLNFMSVVRLIRGCYPMMKEKGGRIITIASYSAKIPLPGLILSNSFRAGILGLMKTLANELAADGILLNTVCPGRIATDRIQQLDAWTAEKEGKTVEEVQQAHVQDIPIGRYGTPQEFAEFSSFLLSPRNTYMTGSTFYVDGGLVKSL